MNRRRNFLQKRHSEKTSPVAPRLLDAARNNDMKQIEQALRGGESINVQDEDGNSALHQAVMFNLYDVISYLIYMGADPELKNKEGQTVLDMCRDGDMKSFLKQAKRLTVREDLSKISEDTGTLSKNMTVTFDSCYVRVTSHNLAENETVTLRCRSVRLEEVSWSILEESETACSDAYIILTDRNKLVKNCEVEIPVFNLPKSTEEIAVKTDSTLIVDDVIAYDRKRVSYCKFTVDLSPVVSLLAICRNKTEVFDVFMATTKLVSKIDKQLRITFPENSIVSPGHIQLQVHSITDHVQLLQSKGIDVPSPIVKLNSNDLHLSADARISIPLSNSGIKPADLTVFSLPSFDLSGSLNVLKYDMATSSQAFIVSHPACGIIAAVDTRQSNSKVARSEVAKDIFKLVLNKETRIQFQIGSKQRRSEQKRCKVIVTCSPEEEVDKTVELWERDGFHVQWCTETYTAVSGETFSITMGGSMIFCDGFEDKKLQFHPRRRNFVMFEVMSNDVLANVNLTNVDIRPTFSNSRPETSYYVPIKKNIYIRATNSTFLKEMIKSDENEFAELDRETSDMVEKPSKVRKKKKNTLLRKLSRENTKEKIVNNNKGKDFDSKSTDSNETGCQNATTSSLGHSSNSSLKTANAQGEELRGQIVPEKSSIDANENKESKQKEITNISSESTTLTLTSLDAEEVTGEKNSTKNSAISTNTADDNNKGYGVNENSIVTSDRPITVRSIMLENPAANMPVETVFFSDAYLSVLLDEIGENWLTIYILLGIPFDVIDTRLMESHGKSPLHEMLLQLLTEWRDEHSYHVHKGCPNLLSALRKGGKWDLSISVQRRLKNWYDQKCAVEDPLYIWLETAYADSDVFIPAEYPRPMSDAFLVMFASEIQFSNALPTALSVSYEEFYDIQENRIYLNDTLKVMKLLTLYRLQTEGVVDMLEELVGMCNRLDFKRASQNIVVSLKGWLKRSATDDDPLKGAVDKLLSKPLQQSRKCNTPDSLFRQRLDVRSALRVLRTPANVKSKRDRDVHSEYGTPSTST